MRLKLQSAPLLAFGFILGCSPAPSENKPTARQCMGEQARLVAREQRRALTFEEARGVGLKCLGTRSLHAEEPSIDTLACAYSEDWDRCGLPTPID